MTRFAATENADAVALPHVPYVLFVDLDFASGHVRLNSCDRSFTFGSNTYEAIGKLGGIGPVNESAALNPDKLEFTLAGVDNALISTVITEKYHGRSATLYVGYCDEEWTLLADPEVLWEGRMDTMAVRAEQNGAAIKLVCENRLIIWNLASGWRYTNEHQQLLFSGDTFFDRLASLMNKILRWGDARTGELPDYRYIVLPPITSP